MTMTVRSGIYCIYFDNVDDKYYIGCSIDIDKRLKDHLAFFKRGKHPNTYMQSTYNKYGEPVTEVLEICDSSVLYEREIYYIKLFNSYRAGYNRTTGGDGGGHGEGNTQSKHSEGDYLLVLNMLAYTNDTFTEISKYTGVSVSIIKHISRLSAHAYLKDLAPEAYNIVKSKHNNRDNSAATKGITYPEIISPEGSTHVVTNIHKFAEEHGLQYQNLHKVLTGKRLSHLGWKINGSND